jgi:DNA-binding XRE family transcriptional regulator
MRTERTAIFDKTPGSLLRHFRIFGFTILGGLARSHFADWAKRSGICDVTAADLERIESNRQTMPTGLYEFLRSHYPKHLGTPTESLRGARERLGWTQERLAVELDVSQSLIARVEAGQRALPPELAQKLREAVINREGHATGRGCPICHKEMACFPESARGQKRGSETSATTPKAA